MISTTMDASPPSVPELLSEPPYSPDTTNPVEWWPSTDAGVGNVSYELEWSTSRDFADAIVLDTGDTNHTVDSLLSGTTYHYRVRARDGFGHWSPWSAPASSTQDGEAPTAPEMLAEPAFTEGASNVFTWQQAFDAGVGVSSYRVRVATDPAFGAPTIVLERSTTLLYVDASGLLDGVTYYAQAMAADAFDHRSAWSDPVNSTQDASGPGVPGLHGLGAYSAGGSVTLSWDGATDAGIGLAWYSVSWSTDPAFATVAGRRDHILGQSEAVSGLNETRWYFRVVPFDAFGQAGTPDTVSTTFDTAAPTAPVLAALPGFDPVTDVVLEWTASTDAASGMGHYSAAAYSEADLSVVMAAATTSLLTVTFRDLTDGATYYFAVSAVDAVGNSAGSNVVSTTIDGSPPPAPELGPVPSVIAATSLTVSWACEPDDSGRPNEYRVLVYIDSGQEPVDAYPWTSATTQEVSGLVDGTAYVIRVVARDPSGWTSIPSFPATTTVDLSPPTVVMLSPSDGETVDDILQVYGRVTDPHLLSYAVRAAPGNTTDWRDLELGRPTGSVDGILATWVLVGMPEGVYRIMVTATDSVGHTASATVSVKRLAANVSLYPSDITFSDPRPQPGDQVTVYVAVHNEGTADATGMTLVVMADGTEVLRQTGVTVPAHGRYVASVTVNATDRPVTFTARATSPLHDTGPMSQGAELLPAEAVTTEATATSAMVYVALAVAVIAIVVAVYLGTRARGAPPA